MGKILKIEFRGLNARLILWIGGIVVLGLAACIVTVGVQGTRIVQASAFANAEAVASDVASDVGGFVDRGIVLAESVADAVVALKKGGQTDRKLVNQILRQAIERHPQLLGVWACFEPNAFDGKDASHTNQEGSDEQGRFSPYWNLAAGKVAVEFCPEYWTKDYYKIPKQKKKPVLLDPFLDKAGNQEVLMASYTLPLLIDDTVIGVVGVDFDLGKLGRVARNIQSGYASIISQGGLYVYHPDNKRLAKKFLDHDGWAQPFVEQMAKGEAFRTTSFSHTLGKLTYRFGAPVELAQRGAVWTVVLTQLEDEVLAPVARLRNLTAFVGASVMVVLLVVLWLLARGISRPLEGLAADIHGGADQTSAAANQVTSASQHLAAGSSEQAASLEETSSSLEEMASMARQNSDHALKAKDIAQQASRAADQGVTDMAEMQQAMEEIQRSSAEIGQIIKTIDEIAFQTNILALNAAVEAARAGEAGAGFAVVAEEVRNLAQRAATAAKDSASKIEGAITRTANGAQISAKVSTHLHEITAKVHEVNALIAEVANASSEQNRGITQINAAVTKMDQVTQQNAASAEETASAAEELNAQAEFLRTAVAKIHQVIHGR